MPAAIGVGLLGVGVVGSAVARALLAGDDRLALPQASRLDLKRAAVRDASQPRPVPRERLTTEPEEIVGAEDVQLVVELMGGEEPAGAYIRRALEAGQHVVTANKEVLAKHGDELLDIAAANGVRLLYEGSVGGGIPILGPLSSDLLANELMSIRAIINGTTNYILTRMSTDGMSFEDALSEAQSLGYAEADPTSDVDAFDAAYKIAILGRLGFRSSVPLAAIYREGIRMLDPLDIGFARTLGYAIKLLAVARKERDGLLVRVHPALVPLSVPMAKVDGVLNACEIEGDLVGPLWFQGRGAGAEATASAVLGDVIRIARRPAGAQDARSQAGAPQLISMDAHECQFYLRLVAQDRAGVLSRVAGVLASLDISIDSVIQMGTHAERGTADIVLTTHQAREKQVQQARKQIAALEVVEDVPSLLRVESYPLRGL